MMRLAVRMFASTAAALLVTASTAGADTILITSGALVWPSGPVGTTPPTVTLNGSGFTFTAFSSPSDGLFTPLEQCGVPGCTAGTSVDLGVNIFGLGFRNGTATYQGTTYDRVGGFDALDPAMAATWDGSLMIPAGFTGGSLTAPFTFSGFFAFPDDGPAFTRVDLIGTGTASITFAPFTPTEQFPGAFMVTSLRYDFEAAAPPVPEPASLLLLGTGLAGIAAARRRRAAGTRED